MKKLGILLASLFVLGVSTARADQDNAIAFEQLPQAAREFIGEYFAGEQAALVKRERDFFEVRYEVLFTSGKKVEFFRDGSWKEVDCRYAHVPQGVVPEPIRAKIGELYPEAGVLEIERMDRGGYAVKLSVGIDLEFDARMMLVEIEADH